MPELDLDTIAAAGLAVADACGPKDFTMRAVADRLGVTSMALYHYVTDKRALVELVVDGVIRERPLPAPTGEWVAAPTGLRTTRYSHHNRKDRQWQRPQWHGLR